MIRAACSCLTLLALIFGLLTWANRREVRDYWREFWRDVTSVGP